MNILWLLWLALNSAAAQAGTVRRIEIAGPSTHETVLRRFLDTQEGREFDPTLWEHDVQRLKNMGFFYNVLSERLQENGRELLRLKAKNKFSTIPIFKYKQGGGTSLLTLGVYDINVANRLLEAGAQYERMNAKNGFVAWFRHPYLGSRRNILGFDLYHHTIGLPLLAVDGRPEAFFDNKEIRLNSRLQHELTGIWRLEAELSLYQNDFTPDNASAQKAASNTSFLSAHPLKNGFTASFSPKITFGKFNRDQHYVEGLEMTVQGEISNRFFGSDFNFVKGQISAAAGWRPHERLNIAAQGRLGSKTRHEFQHKFYLGGLDTIRGFLDGQFRGEHMWLANIEARPTLAERPLWVLQGNLFTDFSKTWDAVNFNADGFKNPFFSYGAGLRLILPRVYRAILRLDIARTAQPLRQTGLSLGLQQFF